VVALLAELVRSGARPPLVVCSTIPWEVTLFQRPQQLAIAAAEASWPVIYVKRGEVPRFVRPRLLVWSDLASALRYVERAVCLLLSTDPDGTAFEIVKAAGPRVTVVYDFIDEQHEDIGALDDVVLRRHEGLLRDADVVLVTADRLAEQARAIRSSSRPTVLSPNGVDVNHFASGRMRQRPTEMARFAGRPVVGYYGALAGWFDYALVDRLAAIRSGYDIVLIGIDYDRSLARSGILRRRNVYFLGPRSYDELPRYLACFDVATIPFVLNDVTASTSPIKLFEYMAGGRPIVTTDLRECRKYRSVRIGKSHDDFIRLVDDAIARKVDAGEASLLAREADENSWSRRVMDLMAAVDGLSSKEGLAAGGS
jgi:glycosyltransferase involved in cell wall biosynthesis